MQRSLDRRGMTPGRTFTSTGAYQNPTDLINDLCHRSNSPKLAKMVPGARSNVPNHISVNCPENALPKVPFGPDLRVN
jgi:hypothetical protein